MQLHWTVRWRAAVVVPGAFKCSQLTYSSGQSLEQLVSLRSCMSLSTSSSKENNGEEADAEVWFSGAGAGCSPAGVYRVQFVADGEAHFENLSLFNRGA